MNITNFSIINIKFIFPEETNIEPKIIPLDLDDILEESFKNYINQNNLQELIKTNYYFYLQKNNKIIKKLPNNQLISD